VKKLLPYIILFVVSSVSATLVFVLLAVFSPQTLNPNAAATVAAADSSADSTATADSSLAQKHGTGSDSSGVTDTTAIAPEMSPLAGQKPDSAHNDSTAVPTSALAADSVRKQENKNLAKVFEAMEPERAAAIMKNLSDAEVRSTILILKRRQAAKILAALDPDRVARIMR
jgi:hypothetical protein